MPFQSVDDIEDIELRSVDLNELDAAMIEIVTTSHFTLNKFSNFKRRSDYDKELAHILQNHLNLFITTHESMSLLLDEAFVNLRFAQVADAVSLAREQVEKIYIIALLLDDPNRWVTRSLRTAWRKEYAEFLLLRDELGSSPRLAIKLNKEFPEYFEKSRRPKALTNPKGKPLVSKFAKRVLDFQWNNPGAPKPPWFKLGGKIRDYLSDYFEFPTPGKSISKIKRKKIKPLLNRWHKEYQYICAYSHVALDKAMIQGLSETKNILAIESIERYAKKQAERASYISYLATASACATVLDHVNNHYGAKQIMKEFWEQLNEASLLSRSLWNLYGKKVLK